MLEKQHRLNVRVRLFDAAAEFSFTTEKHTDKSFADWGKFATDAR